MRGLRNCLLLLICALVVLGVGSIVPRLVFSGEGLRVLSGEKKAFAKFALLYDTDLREWPFPIDPTVARRVTEVTGTHDESGPCDSEEGSRIPPLYTGYYVGDYRAEVVHYGPFFVPTGKNVFHCDVASTYHFLLPRDYGGALFNVLGPLVAIGALVLAIGTIVVPAFLLVGGSVLILGDGARSYRVVGLGALLVGALLGGTVLFTIATSYF